MLQHGFGETATDLPDVIYTYRVITIKRDRDCPQFPIVSYSDHNMVTCKLDIERRFGYWILAMPLLAFKEYRDRIRLLI